MEQGEKGQLALIAVQEYHQNVAVDLQNGIVHLGFDGLSVNNENKQINIDNIKASFTICEETNRIYDLYVEKHGEPNDAGDYTVTRTPIEWRPIWFTRNTFSPIGVIAVKVIGAQCTLPPEFGGKNVKKLISLFADGTIGID